MLNSPQWGVILFSVLGTRSSQYAVVYLFLGLGTHHYGGDPYIVLSVFWGPGELDVDNGYLTYPRALHKETRRWKVRNRFDFDRCDLVLCVPIALCVCFVCSRESRESLACMGKKTKKKKKNGFLHHTPLTSWKRMMMILTHLRIGTMMLTTTMASRETIAMCRRIDSCASWACNYYISRLINFLIFFTHICALIKSKVACCCKTGTGRGRTWMSVACCLTVSNLSFDAGLINTRVVGARYGWKLRVWWRIGS